MATYNEKSKSLIVLNNLGHNILEIEINSQSRFFIARQFEPPVGGSVSAAPFFTFTGFDITEFLVGNIYTEGNIEQFKIALESLENKSKDNDYKFSDSHIWRFFE